MKASMRHSSFYFIILLGAACTGSSRYYSLHDYPLHLQPYIAKVVSKGIVGYDTATRYVTTHTTDDELRQLSHSEHAVLRATAIREMLNRPSFDHFQVIMSHLDDTAMVVADEGEWGWQFSVVSDYVLSGAKWKDSTFWYKTVETVIIKHNYLKSAYRVLERIHPSEELYSNIKNMVTADVSFEQIENALYALAKYQKQEDIPMIRDMLLKYHYCLSDVSFKLMREYPDSQYLRVFEEYYPRDYRRRICRERDINKAESFIKSLATYKNKRSARILGDLLDGKPDLTTCCADLSQLQRVLSYAIWENECPAYTSLRKRVKAYIGRRESYDVLSVEEPEMPVQAYDPEPVRW